MASILTSLSKYEHFNIFSYLEVKDLTSFLYVNKKERNFVLDFFRENKSLKIKKNDVSRLRREYTIKNLFKTFPKLIILKINAFNFSAESFEHIPKTLTYLHLLNCKESLLFKTDLYTNLQERLGHSLKELHIEYFSELDVLENNESEDLTFALEKFAKEMIVLEVLTVWAICQGEQAYTMQGINNKFFYAFYSHSLSLTSVNFNNLVIWQNLRLSKSKIRNLKVKTTEGFLLDARDDHQIFGLNDQTISFLTYYFEHIENLAICDYLMSQRKNLSDNTLTNFVIKFPGLRTLYLNSYSHKFHLNEMTILQTVSNLNSLNSFGIASCKNFQLGNIVSVTPNLSNISNLNLDFTEIDDYSLHLATSLFKHLKSISLKCCRKVSEDGFGFLTQNLPNLEGCNFKYNFNFGSTALKNLVLNSKKLKKIKLGNNFLSNTDITTIFHRASNLKELAFCAMNDSDNFSQDCFSELTSNNLLNSDLLWKLKSLDLSNNSVIDDTSILHLTQLGLKNLAFLSLAGCSQMTQDCFEYIALSSFAERLYDLNLCIETLYIDLELFEDYRPKFKRLACVYLFRSANAKTLEDKFFYINFVLK